MLIVIGTLVIGGVLCVAVPLGAIVLGLVARAFGDRTVKVILWIGGISLTLALIWSDPKDALILALGAGFFLAFAAWAMHERTSEEARRKREHELWQDGYNAGYQDAPEGGNVDSDNQNDGDETE